MKYRKLIEDLELIKAQAEWDYPLDWQLAIDNAILCVKRCEEWDDTVEKCYKVEHEEAVRKNEERKAGLRKCPKCGKDKFEFDGQKYTTEWVSTSDEPIKMDMSKADIPKEWTINTPFTEIPRDSFNRLECSQAYINGYTKGMQDCLDNIVKVMRGGK